MTATFTIDRALTDPRLLGAGLGAVESWRTWLVVLKAAFGLPLDEAELQTFVTVAGSRVAPTARVRELWCVAGRRSGKSRMAAAIAIYLALFTKHKLARGEKGMCVIIAGSTAQAGTVFGYVRGFLEASPALAKEVAAVSRHEVTLRNGIVIAVHSNSFRTVRGRNFRRLCDGRGRLLARSRQCPAGHGNLQRRVAGVGDHERNARRYLDALPQARPAASEASRPFRRGW